MSNWKLHKKNRKYLDTEMPELKNQIQYANQLTRDYTCKLTSDNALILREDMACLIHSKYDLAIELEKTLETVDAATHVLILFGLGFGHIAKYLIVHKELYPSLVKIIIIEPVPEIFEQALFHLDLEKLLNTFESVEFIIGNDYRLAVSEINQVLIRQTGKKIDFGYNITYRSIFSDYYTYIMEWVVKEIQIWRSNLSTIDHFKIMWLNNTLNNFSSYSPPVTLINGFFEDKPVLLVSAGPSLNDMIGFIKENGESFYIAAVGSAIGILNFHGIVPDFYFSIDGSPEQLTVFKDISQEPILIYSDSLYYQVVKNYTGPKLVMFIDANLMAQYIIRKTSMKIEMTPGNFSVALFAMNSLIAMGFKRLYLIGQDLAYSNGKLYSNGAWHEGYLDLEGSASGLISTVDKRGEQIYTDTGFVNMKNAIESIIHNKMAEGINFYNLGKTGVVLEGTIDGSYDDLLNDVAMLNHSANKAKDKVEILRLMGLWESTNDHQEIINQIISIKNDVEQMVIKTNEYYLMIINEEITEHEIAIKLESYFEFLEENELYTEVFGMMLIPAFYSIEETCKNESYRKRQKLKVSETFRVLLATLEIINEL